MPTLGEGQLFERYRVVRWLGSGVTGETYEGEDRILMRKITLKLIHPWASLTDAARRQFFREIQGISALTHPQIATVLDYGEIEGHMYVARRYVSSGSLLSTNGRQWFRPPLPIADAFKYAHQLAQALQYIHQHGYLHGALTFSNVLVLRGPNLEQEADYAPFLIADIGLANFVRRFGAPRIETLPLSASPEQLGKRVTPASDQFALAVLLYFWLTGRPPYLGAPDEIEQLKLSGTVPQPATFNPGLTSEQDYLLLRALRVHPDERYPSVLDFTQALMATLTSDSFNQTTPPTTLPTQPETPRDLLYTPVDAALAGSFIVEKGSDQTSQQSSANGSRTHSAAPEIAQSTHTPTNPPLSPSTEQEPAAVQEAPEALPVIPETPYPTTDASLSIVTLKNTPEAEIPTELLSLDTVPAQIYEKSSEEPSSPLENAALSTEDELIPESDIPQTPVTAEETLRIPETDSQSSDYQSLPVEPDHEKPEPVTEETASSEPATMPLTDLPATDTETEHAKIDTPQQHDRATISPRLIVVSPYTNNSYEFLLNDDETNVGRAGSSDLLLDRDDLTSRHHAVVKRLGGRFLIFDKHSYNGVYVNGQKLEAGHSCELADGDHIGIGNYELIFRHIPVPVNNPSLLH